MPISNFGANSFIDKGYDLQRAYQFQVSFTNGSRPTSNGGVELLTWAVQSISLPKVNIQPVDVSYGNANIKLPGTVAWEDLQVTFVDVLDTNAGTSFSKYLYEWMNNGVYNFETDSVMQFNMKEHYIQELKNSSTTVSQSFQHTNNILITAFSPDGSVLKNWFFEGVWPMSIDFGQLDYTGNNAVAITVTFPYTKLTYQEESSSTGTTQGNINGQNYSIQNGAGILESTALGNLNKYNNQGSFLNASNVAQTVQQLTNGGTVDNFVSTIIGSGMNGKGFSDNVYSMDDIKNMFSSSIKNAYMTPLNSLVSEATGLYNRILGSIPVLGGGIESILPSNVKLPSTKQVVATVVNNAVDKVLGQVNSGLNQGLNSVLGGFSGGSFGLPQNWINGS